MLGDKQVEVREIRLTKQDMPGGYEYIETYGPWYEIDEFLACGLQGIQRRNSTPEEKIKKMKLKVNAQIEGDSIRVKGAKLDDLQKVIAGIRGMEWGAPLVFENMR